MQQFHDVFEVLVDGVSGIAPGDVSGKCLAVGVCSLGQVGKIYYLGPYSDLDATLGVGPLVDRLRDIFATAGQDATVLALPVQGSPAGYVGAVAHQYVIPGGPAAQASGAPNANADVVAEVVQTGALGVATVRLSLNGGESWGEATAVPANGQVVCTVGALATGATLVFEAGNDLQAGDRYVFSVRLPIGPVEQIGPGPAVTVTGTVKAAAQIVLQIMAAGGRNAGQYQLSLDGGDSYGPWRTIPADGVISLGSTGATLTWPEAGSGVTGSTYRCELLEPAPLLLDVMDRVHEALEVVDPEFIFMAGPSDSVDWAAFGVLADEMFNKHRPLFVLGETRLPRAGETLDDWVTSLKRERAGFAHRFVALCAGMGEIMDRDGYRHYRSAGGLLAGRIIAIPVMRAVGRVRDGAVSQATLPEGWTEAHVVELESDAFIPLKRYASLKGCYWGEGRTLAEDVSDFRWIEVLRVVFKGLRLLRIQALKSLYDEAGDPLQEAGAAGLNFLKANLENALDSMIRAVPQELAGQQVVIPPGQDIVNNGVAVDVTFIGIPIIRKITLYAKYIYAGSRFDPRLSAQ